MRAPPDEIRTVEGALPVKTRLSLRTNVVWTLAGNFAYGACQWGMVVALAKLGTPEMVGQFALAFAVTAPVITLANMNLRGVLATDQRDTYGFGEYLGLRLMMLAAAVVLSATLGTVFFGAEQARIIVVVALAKAVEAISDVYYGYMQQRERLDSVGRALILKGGISLGGLTIGIVLGNSTTWAVVGLAAAWAAVLFVHDIPAARRVARVSGNTLGQASCRLIVQARLAWLALPLGLAATLGSLLVNVPRFFLERTGGTRELGFFAALAYFMIVGGRVVSALGESASPRLARYYSDGDVAGFRRLLGTMLAVGTAVGALGIIVALIFGRDVLRFLYRPEYAEYAHVLVLIMLASTLNHVAVFLQYAMTASRVFTPQPLVVFMSLCVVTAACVPLVSRSGSAGAVVAISLGLVVQVIGYGYVTLRAWKAPRAAHL
jgi:O-antigen/teichoic acid export membrane protein